MKYKNINWKRLSLREYGSTVNYSNSNKKQMRENSMQIANIKRCEMEKKMKNINDPHVYGNKRCI